MNDYNNDVRRDINQLGRESGLLDESELDPNSPLRYRVRVRRWSEILESADQRLVYYKRGLQHNASLLDVKRYLREHRADVLPEGLFSEDDPNQAGVSSVRLELCSDWCQRLHTHRTVTRGCSVPELGGVPFLELNLWEASGGMVKALARSFRPPVHPVVMSHSIFSVSKCVRASADAV